MSKVTQKWVTIESSSKDTVTITVAEEDNGNPGICTIVKIPRQDLENFIKKDKE